MQLPISLITVALMASAVLAQRDPCYVPPQTRPIIDPTVPTIPTTTGCSESSEGLVYYVTFMSNLPDQPKNVPVEIFVATDAGQALVTVESAAGSEQKTVTNGQIVRFQVPREAAVLNSSGKTDRTKVVRVSSNQRIIVYGANKEQYTTDAFLALPENVIGTQYYAVTWYPPANFAKPDYCEIAIAATKDGATVTITLPQAGSNAQTTIGDLGFIPCQVEHEGRTYTNGQTLSVQLQSLEAFQLQATCDLTGTFIRSSRPVSVFSGNGRTSIGPGAITRDHLVEQLMPVPTWGRNFVTHPIPRRTVGDYYKIVASEDGTQVTLTARDIQTQTRTLNAGQQWQVDLSSRTHAYIAASRPIQVVAFVKSQTDGTEPADPAMSLVLPLEQLGVAYTFTTVEGVATTYTNYLTVICQKGKENLLVLDGNSVNPVEGWVEVPGSNATAGYVQLQPGAHTLTSRNGGARFAAYIYGAGDRESYYYPTGVCVKSLQQPAQPVCPSTPGCCCQACANNNVASAWSFWSSI